MCIIVRVVGVLIVTVAKLLYLLHDTDQPVGSEYVKFKDSVNKKIISYEVMLQSHHPASHRFATPTPFLEGV